MKEIETVTAGREIRRAVAGACYLAAEPRLGPERRILFDVSRFPPARGALGSGFRTGDLQSETRDLSYRNNWELSARDARAFSEPIGERKMGAGS
jgi:hypothetical protein